MIGRTKYLLAIGVASGAAALQASGPVEARPAEGGLKFRVLPPLLRRQKNLQSFEKALAFSRDGRALVYVTGAYNTVSRKSKSSIVLRDVRSGRVLESVSEPSTFLRAATTSGATTWIGGGGQFTGTIKVRSTSQPKWRVVARGYAVYDKDGHSNGFRGLESVGSLAASPDGRKLIVGVSSDGEEIPYGHAQLLDAYTGRIIKRLPGPQYAVDAVAFSPDGRTVAFCNTVGDIRICSARTGVLKRKWHSPAKALAFRGRDELVSVSSGGAVRLWNTRNGRLKRRLREKVLLGKYSLSFVLSPNGHALVVSDDFEPTRLYAIP